ncbi:MAG: flagellin [Candidatus Gastranaerophilaceae bacterium]
MLNINTNLSSLVLQSNLKLSANGLNVAIERMTSGFRINHAKDNAANYAINTNLSTKISAYQVAEDNAIMGLDMVQTANSSLSQVSDILTRLRSLEMYVQNGTYGKGSLSAIKKEASALTAEISRILNNTEYGDKLFTTPARETQSGFVNEVVHRDTSAMTTLESVDETVKLTSGTYSISSAKELAKLATMTNNALVGTGVEFVLGADIDLSEYSNGEGWVSIGSNARFCAKFDGNGYVVSNLYIMNSFNKKEYLGLFGFCGRGCEIKNLGIEDVDITTIGATGALAGYVENVTISNCYVKRGKINGCGNAGGLFGHLAGYDNISLVTDCYSDVSVTSTQYAGGISGLMGNAIVRNCSSYSIIKSLTKEGGAGGITGGCHISKKTMSRASQIENCQVFNVNEELRGVIVAALVLQEGFDLLPLTINNCSYDSCYKGCTVGGELYGAVVLNNITTFAGQALESPSFQVGINGNESSKIGYSMDLLLDGVELFGFLGEKQIGVESIDYYLKKIALKQTELGALENRLMSALEQIKVSYDNLVSTQSTIRDADIAEESSAYIRSQILQQASATLLAAANQSPSIALQLL